MALKICRRDVVKLTVYVVALDQALTAVFEATCNGERAAAQFERRFRRFESPLDDIRTIILFLFGSKRVIELLIGSMLRFWSVNGLKKTPVNPGRVPSNACCSLDLLIEL